MMILRVKNPPAGAMSVQSVITGAGLGGGGRNRRYRVPSTCAANRTGTRGAASARTMPRARIGIGPPMLIGMFDDGSGGTDWLAPAANRYWSPQVWPPS